MNFENKFNKKEDYFLKLFGISKIVSIFGVLK
jgi:hypothetical protein